jgi:hypothetical protein
MTFNRFDLSILIVRCGRDSLESYILACSTHRRTLNLTLTVRASMTLTRIIALNGVFKSIQPCPGTLILTDNVCLRSGTMLCVIDLARTELEWNCVLSREWVSGSILLLKRIDRSFQQQTESSVDQYSIGRRKWLLLSVISSIGMHNMYSLLWVEISQAHIHRESGGGVCASSWDENVNMAPYDTIVGIGIVFICIKALYIQLSWFYWELWLLALCTNRLLLS